MKQKLKPLKNTECLYVCFGSGKLFKAQNNLVENGYKTLTEWGVDWGKNPQLGFFFMIYRTQRPRVWNYDESFPIRGGW